MARTRVVLPGLLGMLAVLVAAALPAPAAAQPATAGSTSAPRWFRGNTHTHTLNSDGDSTPDDVVRWYREHRYQFLGLLTDHNYLTAVDGLNATLGGDDRFLLIPGEEVTDQFEKAPVHVNGIDLRSVVMPRGGGSPSDVASRDVAAIRAAGALSQVDQPKFGWALPASELLRVPGIQLLEVFNGHPQVNNVGGGGLAGAEEIWDALLSAGTKVYGVASDDAHQFQAPWNAAAAKPGQGWVMVRAAELTAQAIVDALARGDFYASTGVELQDVTATPSAVTVRVSASGTTKYRVQFVGKGGRVLAQEVSSPAVYSIKGDEGYVRAKVIDSNGRMAWTQPVFVGTR